MLLLISPSPVPTVITHLPAVVQTVGGERGSDRLGTAAIGLASAVIGALVTGWLTSRHEAKRLRKERSMKALGELMVSHTRALEHAATAERLGQPAGQSERVSEGFQEMQRSLLTHGPFLDCDDLRDRFDCFLGLLLRLSAAKRDGTRDADFTLVERYGTHVRDSAKAFSEDKPMPPTSRPRPGELLWSTPGSD